MMNAVNNSIRERRKNFPPGKDKPNAMPSFVT
jgi:hypothetical protein